MSDLINDGMTKVVWVSSIANINAPTVAELNAGADYTPRITPDGLKKQGATTLANLYHWLVLRCDSSSDGTQRW